MIRKIITINKDKCNGCGLCVTACHEGAIGLKDGKAQLLRDDYCDGLGDCLPACPTGAITFEEREALAYDQEEVQKQMEKRQMLHNHVAGGCPGSHAHTIQREAAPAPIANQDACAAVVSTPAATAAASSSQLRQWPVQIKLAPVNAPYFQGAHLLVAADCSAYAFGAFHDTFMRGRITLIGCPKLDSVDYSEKLTEILRHSDIKSVMVVRMEVPCCGGIEHAVTTALQNSGKMIPWQVITLSTDGKVLDSL